MALLAWAAFHVRNYWKPIEERTEWRTGKSGGEPYPMTRFGVLTSSAALILAGVSFGVAAILPEFGSALVRYAFFAYVALVTIGSIHDHWVDSGIR